ncbi:uncharacterized protein LOC129773783 [Toxorhynchites rutilus septentrionalis]|uniref:uncharacterized protein LOC129773783 n=1 Tax=Toxorhynchites rutilus septentrionalis TaxID=329112 RepID=UPI00247885B5|nr:uncharacterized protein LOC129773783 [Toxorhynchites rutilus septentrionalis]
MDEIKLMLAEEKHLPLTLAFQEARVTKITPDFNLSLQGKYKWYFREGLTSRQGGVCLAVLSHLPHTLIQISSQLQICAIQLTGPLRLTLASIYISPTHSNSNLEAEMNNAIQQLPHPFIIMGDFNAYHTVWGGQRCNLRGKIILKIVEQLNLIILNDFQHTRMDEHSGSTSSIDLTITSWDLAPRVRWCVDDDLRGSDHFPIHIRTLTSNPKILLRRRWLYQFADWDGFESTISHLLPAQGNYSVEEFSQAVFAAAKANIPRTSGIFGRKAVPWWNNDVKQAIKSRRKALRKLRRQLDGSETKVLALADFQSTRARSRKIIAEAKQNSWLKFLDSFCPQTTSSELWSKVNAISGKKRSRGYSIMINGTTTDDPGTIAEHLADHFASTSATSNYKSDFKARKTAAETTEFPSDSGEPHIYNIRFSMKEMLWSISKVFERMIKRRLMTNLEERHLLDPRQHAFRQGNGTNTYFSQLDQHLHVITRDHLHGELALLDISKAYDTTWRYNILDQLHQWGIEGNLFEIIRSFLQNRSFKVLLGGVTSTSKLQENGVPQGSVLSVALFLIAMQSLFDAIPQNIDALLYADDILLISKNSFPVLARRRLQEGISSVNNWANSVGFRISAEKSQVLHCCNNKRHRKKLRSYLLNGSSIKRVNSARILGVMVDKKLTFNKHIKSTISDIKNRLNLVSVISGGSRTGSRKTIFNIGRSLVYSKLTYGIELFSRATWKTLEELRPSYQRIIRLASGAFRTSPSKALLAESGILPFKLFLTRFYSTRAIRTLEKHPTFEYSLVRVNNWLQDTCRTTLPTIAPIPIINLRPWYKREPQIDWSIKNSVRAGENSSIVLAIFNNHIHSKYLFHHKIFTDGSFDGLQVGIGIFANNLQVKFQLPNICSVFSAELAALLIATSKCEHNRKTVIFTDSASALLALESGSSKHPWVLAIEEKTAQNDITFCWIPGHCGIRGNEEADRLAKEGRTSELWSTSVPSDDITRWVNSSLMTCWENEWNICRDTFLRKIKNTTHPWMDRNQRSFQVCLTRLRIGHTKLTHRFLVEKTEPPICNTCNVRLTVEHFLLVCPRYNLMRTKFQIADNPRTALARDNLEEDKLLHFLKETDLLELIYLFQHRLLLIVYPVL